MSFLRGYLRDLVLAISKRGELRNSEDTYKSLLSRETLEGLTGDQALEEIGTLTDLSLDLRRREGLEHAVSLSEELQRRELPPEQRAISHYFLGNAWSNLRTLVGRDQGDWEQPELECEVFHYRMALREEGIRSLPIQRLCKILTNLGNAMSQVGRPVEALEYRDRALEMLPIFAMARGARGYGLSYYATSVYDEGHKHLMLKAAHEDLQGALSQESRRVLEGKAHKAFERVKVEIEGYLAPCCLEEDADDVHGFPLGDSQEEVSYRRWCLDKRLFLNPLNDIGPYPIAAADVLVLPSIVTNSQEGPSGPSLLGLYNQMKQEFVSARYLYYEGVTSYAPHFADKDVRLYDTLDFPSYSLAVERTKVAFRMAYSLLDKIAFFLNHYLGLSVPDHKVTFRSVWYEGQSRKNGLVQAIEDRHNWPLRGLFWVSKDLFDDDPGFEDALEPEAREWKDIRNGLEHRYLKLHEDYWSRPQDDYHGVSEQAVANLRDALALSRYRGDFEVNALRLLKTVRASLIYLCLAVHWEEVRRSEERDSTQEIPWIRADIVEDDLKV
jgi:tetratricopeptide (TPR) repeat protein